MEAAGRLRHRDWTLYDTAHAVFRPKHMTPEELEHGYSWIYERLFSHQSIWRRRPPDCRAAPTNRCTPDLYKPPQRVWELVIKRPSGHSACAAAVEMGRVRCRRGTVALSRSGM